MKYSQLDETFIHEAKITLDRHIYLEEPDQVSFEFIMPYGYGVTVYYYANEILELSPNFIEEKLQRMVIDPYVVKNQLEENIRLSAYKSRYISSLSKDFPSIVNGKMIDAIRQKRNEVNHRILLLNGIGRNLNLALTELYKKPYFLENADYSAKENEIEFETEFTTYLLEESNYESPEFDRILEDKRLCETFKIQIVNQKIVQYLLSRLFELAETIQDTIQQAEEGLQQPAAEAIEQPDTVRSKLKLSSVKGSKTALYYVLRQLYTDKFIEGSWGEVAEFLIQNVKGFERANKKNLTLELARKSEPMLHRKIDLPENLAELDE